MASEPRTQTALVGLADGSLSISHNAPVPSLGEDMVIVENVACSINPVDTKILGALVTPGAIAGMDFAGHVVAIGPRAQTPTKLKVGDRVCGTVQGMHSLTPEIGAFSQLVGADGIATLKVPDHVTFEQAASLGCVVGTIGLALFRSLEVPGHPNHPAENPKQVLVYGGSTATGTFAIQILKLSGLVPVTTCSPKNFELVKSYGAEAVFDYHSPSATADIKAYTKGSLKWALDCVSEPETMRFCYSCIGRAGGKYTALEPYPEVCHNRPTITPGWVLGPELLGKRIAWAGPLAREDNPEIRPWTLDWFRTVQKLLDEGAIKFHPLRVVDGGFDGILEGMEMLKKKQISAQKLIVRILGTQ